MLLEQVMKESAIANKGLNINLLRADSYAEMAVMEAAINVNEAELKVFTESGSDNDLLFLYEEAQDGLIGKMMKAVQTIIDSIKEFFVKIKDKIIRLFTKKEVESNINELEKKVKFNPFMRNSKVELENPEKARGVVKAYIDKIKSMIARLRSGDNVTNEEIDEAHESFIRKHAVALGVTATVTLGAAIVYLRKLIKKSSSDISESEKTSLNIMTKVKDVIKGVGDSAVAAKLQKLCTNLASTTKTSTNAVVSGVVGTLSKIKNKIKGVKATSSEKDELAEESTRFDWGSINESTSDMFDEFDMMF